MKVIRLDLQEELRKAGKPRGFAASLRKQSIMQNSAARKEFDFSGVSKVSLVQYSICGQKLSLRRQRHQS